MISQSLVDEWLLSFERLGGAATRNSIIVQRFLHDLGELCCGAIYVAASRQSRVFLGAEPFERNIN